jgi:CRP/FNR family cyclic AMP-dependent transcriptional regulator
MRPEVEVNGGCVSTDTELLRWQLFDLMLENHESPVELPDHSQCVTLSSSLRGKLCEQLSQLPSRRLEAGERIYLMGNPARSLFLLQSGLVKTSVISPEGEELTLKIHGAGEIVGELCLCGGGRREKATALEPSTVTELPLTALLGRLKQDPEAALELASIMCERLADAYERVENLSWETVLERLARALLKLATDFGDGSAEDTHIRHYIKQDELAKIVGARREVVSGLLNRLRDSGHISYSPRGYISVNRGALQEFLEARSSA